MLTKILYGLYFLIWTATIGLAYATLTDKFYQTGVLLGPFFGACTLTMTLLILVALSIIYIVKPLKRATTKKTILACLAPLFLLIPFAIIYLLPNNLEEKKHIIQVSYVAWSCDCANWLIEIDNGRKIKTNKSRNETIFIEPANESISVPDSIGYIGDIVQLTGQFYSKKGFPKDYYSQEMPDKARVFRYTSFKIISRSLPPLSSKNKE